MTPEQFTELMANIETWAALIAGLQMAVIFAVTWKG